MQASRFNYLFSVSERHYIFNSISEAIISSSGANCLDELSNLLILKRFKMQVESTEQDMLNLQQKVKAIRKGSRNIADLNILITNKCNLQCPGCFNHQEIQCIENFSQVLDALEGKLACLCGLFDCGVVKKISISLSGGEPLLFLDRLSTVIKTCESILGKREHEYLMLTNGTLLNSEIVTDLYSLGVKDYYISVDSNRYSLPKSDDVNCNQTSFLDLLVNIQQINFITGRKSILRFNINSIGDKFPIDAMNCLYESGLSTGVILDFKRWYDKNAPDNYFMLLPGRIQEMILYALDLGLDCLWKWYDNIDKYLACRVDTGFGWSIHPNGKLSICPYIIKKDAFSKYNNTQCQYCCFYAICFGGCQYKLSDEHCCDYHMIRKMLETHILAKKR